MLFPFVAWVAFSMAALKTAIQPSFSSAVSARRGYVRVGVFRTNAFSPPPSSRGALSSTENPSLSLPIMISPSGKGSWEGEGEGEMEGGRKKEREGGARERGREGGRGRERMRERRGGEGKSTSVLGRRRDLYRTFHHLPLASHSTSTWAYPVQSASFGISEEYKIKWVLVNPRPCLLDKLPIITFYGMASWRGLICESTLCSTHCFVCWCLVQVSSLYKVSGHHFIKLNR